MTFPAITTTKDSLGRTLYWLYTSENGPRLKVYRVWAELQLRKKLVVDKRHKEQYMAGDWIKMRVNLTTHPKVVRIMSKLSVTKCHVIGALHSAWSIADQHADEHGCISMPPEALDVMCETPGFAAALEQVGWLVIEGESMQFVDYKEHNGTTAKIRATDAKRKSEARAASKNSPRHVRKNSDKTQTREEKRREEVLKEKQVKEKFDEPPEFSDETTDDVDWLVAEDEFMKSWNSTDGTISRSRNIVPQDLKPEFRERWRDPHWRELYPQALAKFPLKCGVKLTLVRFLQDSTVEDIIGGKYDFDKQANFGSDSGSRIRTGSTDYDKPGICAESA